MQPLLERSLEFLKARAPVVGLLALVAIVLRCSTERPPPQTVEGLAELLGRSAGAHVEPSDIAWEPQRSLLGEVFSGRPVLFLGAKEAGKPRDVYRAWVRLSVEGKPLQVTRVRNITETEVGDDVALELRGDKAVFATVAFGRIQGISVLDVNGIPAEDQPEGTLDRWLLAVNSYQESGSTRGVGRSDILFDLPARKARIELQPPQLKVDFEQSGRDLIYDVEKRRVSGTDGGQAYAARAEPKRHHPKPFILWAVDTVRAETGPEPIAWLEHKVFGAKDSFKRMQHSLFGDDSAQSQLRTDLPPEDEPGDGAPESDEPATLDASGLRKQKTSWPPPKVPSIWMETKPGEGAWRPIEYDWLAKVPHQAKTVARDSEEAPPAYFYTTFFRPDKKRPYNEVHLIAMDMRRLTLGMRAGFEDPKPLTGPPGSGRLPQDKATLGRVVATFNGAFKTTHGKYGMMVEKRVLLPPIPGGASVIVTKDERVGLGSWPQSTTVPDDILSFRQNLDPLVEDGVANPTNRYIWGWQLSGTSIMTQRTALCVTKAGHLYYVFGREIDGPTLGKALKQAGCSYAIHLDMNPKHCGFVYTDITNIRKKEYRLKTAHPEMAIKPEKYIGWSAKDFFYVMVRDLAPADASGFKWGPAPGAQPPPNWLPALFRTEKKLGQLEVQMHSFTNDRFGWRLRAGSQELTLDNSGPKRLELAGDDKNRVIAAIGLGNTTKATRMGLVFGAVKPVVALSSSQATLIVENQRLRVMKAGEVEHAKAHQELVQLPLLADAGQLLASARERGSLRRRGALCVHADGRVLVAHARHDSSDPVASALLEAGCSRVVELERGSKHPSFIHHAGTETPPLGTYESTALYVVGEPMSPFAFRWKPKGAVPSRKPTGTDYRGPRPPGGQQTN